MVSLVKFGRRALRLWRDRRGITGLETAIVLIAFVVVAAVFAFAVLSTGLLSSEKSKETILGGLEETGATLAVRGNVVANVTSTTLSTGIQEVIFQVSNASQTGEAVNLARTGTDAAILSYTDKNQFVNLASTSWVTTWLIGSGSLVEPGERVEIRVTLTGLSTVLGTLTDFKLELKPTRGATLVVERRIPAEFKLVMDLG
jgi:flagellin FlaB